MGKTFFSGLAALLLIISFNNTVYSQGNTYIFDDAELVFSLPDNWEVSREHVLLLMMPQPKDLQITAELTEEINLDEYIKGLISELKVNFPQDTEITRSDFIISKMKVVELNLITSDESIINNVLVVTPVKKILKLTFNSSNAIYQKYKEEIELIRKNIKKKI